MLKQRKGFTLIELLIVIVIIGILAAIAIPKFGKSREKAFFKAMQSDLRNMMSQQELYFSLPANNYSYADTYANLNANSAIVLSQGVSVSGFTGTNVGWAATANHSGLDSTTQWCEVHVGSVIAGATPGIVFCTGDQ